MTPWRRWRQLNARRRGRRADREALHGTRAQWFLLVGRCDLADIAAPRPEALRPIYPPGDAFWADPFIWTSGQRTYLFFEELPYAVGRGRISVVELDEALRPLGPAVPVLEEPGHLSYPFLFTLDGELYMIPEKQSEEAVDVYRCLDPPYRWRWEQRLISGMRIADATLIEHEGRWWLLCAAKRRGLRLNESLFAFYAGHPLSRAWTPHPANPLVRDFSRARPAGRILRDDRQRLLRPGQDCVRRYGHGLHMGEILELSPRRYRERPLWHRTGPEAGGWRAMHHLDWHRGLIAMDAQRLIGEGQDPA